MDSFIQLVRVCLLQVFDEGMIPGTPRGFYKYKEVEWIELSAEGENAESIVLKLKYFGNFELERSDKGIKLHAYR